MRAKRLLLACLTCLVHVPVFAGVTPASGLRELGRHSPGLEDFGGAQFAIGDFDRDGVDDIVVASNAGQDAALHVYGIRSGAYVEKQWFAVPTGIPTKMLVHTVGGVAHLYVFGLNGTAHEFAGWPLQLLRSFELGPDLFSAIHSAAIGDADNDGFDELIVSTIQGTVGYDLATMEERWSEPDWWGAALLLAQLDGDPALELVIGATPLKVVDGATRAVEWSYPDGFDTVLAYANGGSRGFLGSGPNWSFTVFGTEPWSPVWDAKSFVGALDVHDLDGDGYDEVIVGEDLYDGSIDIFDGSTHAIVSSLPFIGTPTLALRAVDMDGDGTVEIARQGEVSFLGDPFFALHSVQDGSVLLRVETGMENPYVGVSLSAGPGGSLRLAYGSATYNAPRWELADAWTGAVAGHPVGGDVSAAGIAVTSVAIPAAGAMEPGILLGQARAITLIDGSTQAVRWSSDDIAGHPLLGTRELAAMDLVPGPAESPEIGLACAHDPAGTRLFTFALADGQVEWESVVMQDYCRGVMAGDFGGTHLLVAVLQDSLRAFDASTHLLAWSIPGPVDGATLLDGVEGREFVVVSDSQLVFRDAATREVLREFDLGERITAVRGLEDIHTVVVAAGGRLHLVDGETGETNASSAYLGFDLAMNNQLAVSPVGGGTWLVAATTSGGVFRYLVSTADAVFGDGFEKDGGR